MKRKNILHFDMYYYHRISQIPGTYLLAGCFLSDTISIVSWLFQKISLVCKIFLLILRNNVPVFFTLHKRPFRYLPVMLLLVSAGLSLHKEQPPDLKVLLLLHSDSITESQTKLGHHHNSMH